MPFLGIYNGITGNLHMALSSLHKPKGRVVRRSLGLLHRAISARARTTWQIRRLQRREMDTLEKRKNNRLRLEIKGIIAVGKRSDSRSFWTGFMLQKKRIGRDQLLRAGFTIRELRKHGLNSWFMRWMGFKLKDFIHEELSVDYIESAGFPSRIVRKMYARKYRVRKK